MKHCHDVAEPFHGNPCSYSSHTKDHETYTMPIGVECVVSIFLDCMGLDRFERPAPNNQQMPHLDQKLILFGCGSRYPDVPPLPRSPHGHVLGLLARSVGSRDPAVNQRTRRPDRVNANGTRRTTPLSSWDELYSTEVSIKLHAGSVAFDMGQWI